MDSNIDPGLDPSDIDPTIQCSACDAVCCRLTVVLLPGDRVPLWFTVHDERGVECMAKGADGWCVALDRDSLRCSIYHQRPTICRSFAMGGAHCEDERARWYDKAAIPIRIVPALPVA